MAPVRHGTKFVCAAALAMSVVAGCQEGGGGAAQVKGPDGKPLPGDPNGGAQIPNPPSLVKPQLAAVLPIEDAVRAEMKSNAAKEGEFEPTVTIEAEVKNPEPPPATITKRFKVKLKVKWKRLDGGGYQFSFGDPETTMTATPTADGKAEVKTAKAKKTGEHYGPQYLFVAATGCDDAIWVQYVKREFHFFDATGAEKGTGTTKGPEIDQQVPYKAQVQPTPGNPAMEDDPGIDAPLDQTAEKSAPSALTKMESDAGVSDSSITKGTETWTFWSYEICTKPQFQVVGHLDWSFTLTVDTKASPFISESGAKAPAWTAGK